MLSIITYETSNELTSLEFLSNTRDLSTVVVCPNPIQADGFREKLQIGSLGSENLEVVTIAKFVADLVKQHSVELKITRKSELMVILAVFGSLNLKNFPMNYFINHLSFLQIFAPIL